MTDDDTNQPPKADPMAAARAAKARKAVEKAEQELNEAEQAAAPATTQPTISTLQGRAEPVDEGDPVDMVVTFKGHGQISTGGQWGFERLARKAEFTCGEIGARDLYNKGWAEPKDERLAEKWERMNERERAASERRGAREREVLQNGVGANETWRTGANG